MFPLVAIGVAMEAIYAGYLMREFSLLEYYAVPLLDLGKIVRYEFSGGWIFLAAMVFLFGLYYLAFQVCHRRALANSGLLPVVIGGAVVFSITLAFVYPYGAADIFDYTFYGRILAQHGMNPFSHIPAEFEADPFLPYVAWRYMPFAYGPVWAVASSGLSWLGGNNLLVNLLLYKGLAIAAYLAALWLVVAILRHLAPERVLPGAILFAWNPLVVIETAGNGHNDIVMMAFTLLGIWMIAQRTDRPAAMSLVAMAAAALTKFAMAILAPLLAMSLWREPRPLSSRAFSIALGAIMASILAIATYMPFWEGMDTLLGLVKHSEELFTASFAALVKLSIEKYFDGADARWIGSVVLAIFALYCLAEAWRLKPGVQQLVNASFRVTLVYLLLASTWFQPWYLIWLLSFAALLARVDIAHLAMLFSFTATLNYFVFGFVWIWNAAILDTLAVQAIAVAAIYALPLGYALWLLWRSRRPARGCEV